MNRSELKLAVKKMLEDYQLEVAVSKEMTASYEEYIKGGNNHVEKD